MRSGWLLRDGGVVCALEIAETPAERGALRRRDGCDGALHLGEVRTVHTAGMKFPVDVAFLSADQTVLRVARLKPWRLTVGWRGAHSAVEAEAGALERWGLRVGDQLEVREALDGPASNGPPSNGPASNGPASNGPASNGPASNGPASNGPATTGWASDGRVTGGGAGDTT